ncbi:Integrator complex subunit 10 [Basidiobolus ranarum]|uniref:Integrator complex subunit 10 n=1 Tax=Basidiobolus ranarum TaxID=34480 RepID=A0ABR2X567_9FUNG
MLSENTLPHVLENIKRDLKNGVIESAKMKLIPIVNDYEWVFEVQLLLLEINLAVRDFHKAMQIFAHMRVKFRNEEIYKELICRIVYSGLLGSTEEHAELFRQIPRDIRRELLVEVGDIYTKQNRLFDASRIYTFICYLFPHLTPRYGLLAADLVLRAEKESQPLLPVNTYRRFLLYGVLAQIFADKVNCHSLETPGLNANISKLTTISHECLLEWMRLHQAYYIAQIEWKTMHQSFIHISKQCGFLPENCQISSVEPDVDSNLFFPDVLLESLRLNEYALPTQFKSLFLASCFVQICFEYQSLIFNPLKLNECSIPVGEAKSEKKAKKVKSSKSTRSKQKAKAMSVSNLVDSSTPASTPEEILKATAQATGTLRKAQELLTLLESLNGGGTLDQVINDWALPFHIVNAILLCKADIQLMEMKYSDSQASYIILSDRCQTRWREKKEILDGTSILFHPLYQFRLLYSLSLSGEHMGDFKIARKHIFPILYSGLPCQFSDLSFEIEKFSKFRLKPVTSSELLSRSIQRLVTLYTAEIELNGFNNDLIGDLLVLLQFDESQLTDRLQWISQLLIQNGSFVYREFFHFIFSEAIIQQVFQVKNLNALLYSLLPVKSNTDSSQQSVFEVSQIEQNRTLEAHLQLALEKTPKKMMLLREFSRRSYLRDQGMPATMWQRNIFTVGEFWR